jgi:hypothetical protein
MAYSEPIMIVYPITNSSGKPVESAIETAALLGLYPIPGDVEVLSFGCIVTEDFTAHTAVPVLTLGVCNDVGDTALDTNLVSITLDSSATASLKAGDGVKEAQTAITASTDLDASDVILAAPQNFPLHVAGGKFLGWELTTAAGSAGGAFVPFAIVRVNGVTDGRQTNVWTATVKETVAA